MSPNTMSAIRLLLGVLGTFGATAGWFTLPQFSAVTDNILSAIGPLMIAASAIWSWWHNHQVKAAAAVSAVTQNPVVVTGLSTPTVDSHTVSPTATADMAKAKAA